MKPGAPSLRFFLAQGWEAKQPVLRAEGNWPHRRCSEQVDDVLDGNGLGLGHFGKNSMKCADLEWIVQWNGDRMNRHRLVREPYVASLLPNHGVAEPFQRANQPVGRYPARQFHAASKAISSSFTKCNWMSLGFAGASSKWRLVTSSTLSRNSCQVSASVKIA